MPARPLQPACAPVVGCTPAFVCANAVAALRRLPASTEPATAIDKILYFIYFNFTYYPLLMTCTMHIVYILYTQTDERGCTYCTSSNIHSVVLILQWPII